MNRGLILKDQELWPTFFCSFCQCVIEISEAINLNQYPSVSNMNYSPFKYGINHYDRLDLFYCNSQFDISKILFSKCIEYIPRKEPIPKSVEDESREITLYFHVLLCMH